MTQTATHTQTNRSRDVDHRRSRATPQASGDEPSDGATSAAIRAALSLAAGLAVLAAVFANLDRVSTWASEHGPVWVYLGFFLVMSIAGRLFWWGVDTLVKNMASKNPEAGR